MKNKNRITETKENKIISKVGARVIKPVAPKDFKQAISIKDKFKLEKKIGGKRADLDLDLIIEDVSLEDEF